MGNKSHTIWNRNKEFMKLIKLTVVLMTLLTLNFAFADSIVMTPLDANQKLKCIEIIDDNISTIEVIMGNDIYTNDKFSTQINIKNNQQWSGLNLIQTNISNQPPPGLAINVIVPFNYFIDLKSDSNFLSLESNGVATAGQVLVKIDVVNSQTNTAVLSLGNWAIQFGMHCL